MYQKRNNKLFILSLFTGDYTSEFYLREISRIANIPLKTTQTVLNALEKNNILKGKMHGKNKYFKLNLDNIDTKFYLLKSELYKTLFFLEKYPVFKTFVKELHIDGLVLVFGSFAKFKAGKNSDVDILTMSNAKLPTHVLPYSIHRINLSEKFFDKVNETVMKEIQETHIILNNHSYYVNKMWNHYAK